MLIFKDPFIFILKTGATESSCQLSKLSFANIDA